MVTIGSYFSIAASWLPGVICRFQKDYPNVGIKIIEGVHQKLDQLLCEQLADFCLFSYPYKNRPAQMPSHWQNR